MATLTLWLWPALISSLGDRDADVREEAMRLLAGAPRTLLLEATKDPDPEIAARAGMLAGGAFEDWRTAIERNGGGPIPPELFQPCREYFLGIAWSAGVDLRIRCAVLGYLAQTGNPEVISDLVPFLWEPGEQVLHGR